LTIFATSLSFDAPLPMFSLEFRAEVNREETKSHGAILQWRKTAW